MNVSKLRDMLTTSSCVFVPVDDPQKDVLNEIAEVCTYNNAPHHPAIFLFFYPLPSVCPNRILFTRHLSSCPSTCNLI